MSAYKQRNEPSMSAKNRNIEATTSKRQPRLSETLQASSKLTSSEISVMLYIIRLSRTFKTIHISDKKLALTLGLSTRTVSRIINKLANDLKILFKKTRQRSRQHRERVIRPKWKALKRFLGIEMPQKTEEQKARSKQHRAKRQTTCRIKNTSTSTRGPSSPPCETIKFSRLLLANMFGGPPAPKPEKMSSKLSIPSKTDKKAEIRHFYLKHLYKPFSKLELLSMAKKQAKKALFSDSETEQFILELKEI